MPRGSARRVPTGVWLVQCRQTDRQAEPFHGITALKPEGKSPITSISRRRTRFSHTTTASRFHASRGFQAILRTEKPASFDSETSAVRGAFIEPALDCRKEDVHIQNGFGDIVIEAGAQIFLTVSHHRMSR